MGVGGCEGVEGRDVCLFERWGGCYFVAEGFEDLRFVSWSVLCGDGVVRGVVMVEAEVEV